jgi:hypothetical protein
MALMSQFTSVMNIDREAYGKYNDENFHYEFTKLVQKTAFRFPNTKYFFGVFDYFQFGHSL